MKPEIDFALKKFQHAVDSLRDGVGKAKDELDKDGVIQRFEFTFELLWKTLKVVLESQGIQNNTPKDCLRGGFKAGMIEEEDVFLAMLDDRNKTSHLYDQSESERIFLKIRADYLPAMEKLLKKLLQMQ